MGLLQERLIALNVCDDPEIRERGAFRNFGNTIGPGRMSRGSHLDGRSERSAHFSDLLTVRSHNRVV
jgi:hypothetical protein